MGKRILERSIDFHVEENTYSRSFDTLEAARKFAKGKDVRDIYKINGRFKVEWVITKRVDYFRKIWYNGEEITPAPAMKWFAWHEIVAAMEKQPAALREAAEYMKLIHVSDWEYRFLREFLLNAKEDLVIN